MRSGHQGLGGEMARSTMMSATPTELNLEVGRLEFYRYWTMITDRSMYKPSNSIRTPKLPQSKDKRSPPWKVFEYRFSGLFERKAAIQAYCEHNEQYCPYHIISRIKTHSSHDKIRVRFEKTQT